jgi:uncharacterized protein DUF429
MESTKTLGMDLASQPQRTATCLIDWRAGSPGVVCRLSDNLSAEQLLAQMMEDDVTRVAIDAPFGWPFEFVRAISQFSESGRWEDPPYEDDPLDRMRWRATDRVVRQETGITPLSVASDRIAVVAMGCATLMTMYWEATGEPPDRSGQGRLVEVHPAAALRQWSLSQDHHPQDPGSYKGPSAGALRRRKRMLASILDSPSGWLEIHPEFIERCELHDDFFDALVCALIAHAADLGRVLPVADPERAVTEGWIALPLNESLSALSGMEEEGPPVGHVAEKMMPPGGYFEVYMPEQFDLEIQDYVGGPWGGYLGLRADLFERLDDGAYVCTATGGSSIWIRALSINDRGVIEHVDGDGSGHVYRYRLVPKQDEPHHLPYK